MGAESIGLGSIFRPGLRYAGFIIPSPPCPAAAKPFVLGAAGQLRFEGMRAVLLEHAARLDYLLYALLLTPAIWAWASGCFWLPSTRRGAGLAAAVGE